MDRLGEHLHFSIDAANAVECKLHRKSSAHLNASNTRFMLFREFLKGLLSPESSGDAL
jgi:hypothetical protein